MVISIANTCVIFVDIFPLVLVLLLVALLLLS